MTASDRFIITSIFIKDKSDSKSTVPTTCYLPDFFIFGKPSACISLYISSYGSVKCRSFFLSSRRSRVRVPSVLLSKTLFSRQEIGVLDEFNGKKNKIKKL